MRPIASFVLSAIVAFASSLAVAKPMGVAVAIAGMSLPSGGADTLAASVHAALLSRPDVAPLSAVEEARLFRNPKPASKRTKKNLAIAREGIDEATASLESFDFPASLRAINKTKSALDEWIGLKEALDLDRDRLHLAVAIAHAQRNEDRLREALEQYAIRFPNDPPDIRWPPDVVDRLKQIAAPAKTVLNVRAQPRALVYVDGREVGTTPIRIAGLPRGQHRVECVAPGFYPRDQWLEMSDARPATIEVELAPNLVQLLPRMSAKSEVNQDVERALRDAAGKSVGIVILASIEGKEVIMRRFDLVSAPRGEAELARALNDGEGVRLALFQLLPMVPSAPLDAPLWAWIGVGSGAVMAGAGVTLRFFAVATEHEYRRRQEQLTQVEAFELRDRRDAQSLGGAILLGVGATAIAGIIGYLFIAGEAP